MKRNKLWLITVALFCFLVTDVFAQKTRTQKPAKKTEVKKTPPTETGSGTTEGEQKVRDMVAFLEYMLNTLGSSGTPVRDKDVLVTESYSKIFRDSKVQVQDDLDEDRKVITMKDVVAYLKDVDFFFTNVHFEFTIEDIKGSTLPDGQQFYKVTLTRNLKGVTAEGKEVNNTIPRFVEINYNPNDQDLKIVSIYTNEFDQKAALTNWWNELSFEWKSIFRKKLNLQDSVTFAEIRRVADVQDLDLSSNRYIQNIEPLSQLINLRLLDISATDITDLTPIRNLTELVELHLADTKISDLSPLRYASKMQRLNINYTLVDTITVVEKMPALQNLELAGTPVTDFTPLSALKGLLNLNLEATGMSDLSVLSGLENIIELNVSRTPVWNIGPIGQFGNLQVLEIDSTKVADISPLASAAALKVLSANNTQISEILPLQKLPNLERIYCDQTHVKRDKADAFNRANPRVLVIFDSKDLQNWWETLSDEWQNILGKAARVRTIPSKEELARVTTIDSVNFSGNRFIVDLDPLRKLPKLRVLIANKSGITDLSPLEAHGQIRYLDISDTEVKDIEPLRKFSNLEVLVADRTQIDKIDPLYGLSALQKVYADHTVVHDIIAQEFLEKNPRCLIVHKTVHLNRWWNDLPGEWVAVFKKQMGKDTATTRENLHRLVEAPRLAFDNARVNDLSVLGEFVRLKELHFSGTAITSIPGLDNLKGLTSLHATNSPVQRIEVLHLFSQLTDLDISNTAVDELRPLSRLTNLKTLNCAGTQIRKIDPLENLSNLESFDCSNTRVNSLDPLNDLPLKTLKCYNTKVSHKKVKKFKERKPDCQVIYYR